ncbi:ankyrin repeat-containing protein [Aspergillus sclerotialis]|uniref:Ankyrin repeat-containing protein n=1 Tax=Aspergillus sclerotialis TaxID=2070753 RepID=A0A3A2Z8M6_9EURO|nr:ankyrin repeat-containing protein [Aspergillus sclerotialis]
MAQALMLDFACVRADEWDDFAGNLAADLAPLITLFGDRLTKQFLSESISTLDNFIFALAPLGILTAIVSVIRVCGNSSLRAFIGRAQEGPGEAENELLSCVSETTAELFNTGGISRVFGRPRILEVVAWEDDDELKEKSLVIGSLRDALRKKAWYSKYDDVVEDYDLPALDIPSLSLNKGIKRRGQVWFYCAAVLGCSLQTAVIVFAILTVFINPADFQHNDKAVPGYAFPFFILGTALLSTGMFLCAFIIERSSKEYCFYPAKPSKIYWLQPGRQNVGDQVFGAFMGVNEGRYSQLTKDLTYIKSIKSSKYTENMTVLIFTISLTGIGFVIQFVGLRGLHPSVIMAQMGATLIMSIVRTCLRTKRIDAKENQLSSKERDLTFHYQQELDCFAFHLENVESFELLSSGANDLIDSQYTFDSETRLVGESSEYTAVKTNIIRTRTRLAELTSGINKPPNMVWNDLPVRKIAKNLARTIEMTMDLLSSWEPKPARIFDFKLGFRCQPHNRESAEPMDDGSIRLACFHASRPIVDYHTIRLERSDDNLRWKLNEKELEAILGLWTWSLLKSDENWLQKGLGRLIGLDEAEARTQNTDLYFHKWIYRQTEAKMVPSRMIQSATHLFGFYSDELPDNKEVLVVKTQNGLENMAAQDIYIRFLDAIFGDLDDLGGSVDVIPGSQGTFLAQSKRLDELVTCFESGRLGSREDALLCIVPVLRRQNLLPELAADSPNIRKRIEQCVKSENWTEAFSIVRWLCERCEGDEFERSAFELGYLCRRAMLHSDSQVRQIGLGEVCNVLKGDLRAGYFAKLRSSRKAGWMDCRGQLDWWKAFSKQLGWLAWHISKNNGSRMEQAKSVLESLGANGALEPDNTATETQTNAARNKDIMLQWLGFIDEATFAHEITEREDESCFLWALHNDYCALANWLLIRWTEIGEHLPVLLRLAFGWAAASPSETAIQTLCRHGGDINGVDGPSRGGYTALLQVVGDGNEAAARKLLENGADVNAGRPADRMTPLIAASQRGNYGIARLLLSYGADLDLCDRIGVSPLIWAAIEGHINMIQLLVNKGANVNSSDSDGKTALQYAADNNHVPTLRFLLDNGANIDIVNANEFTALIQAARHNSTDAIQFLLSRGADINKKDISGMTALDWAKEYQYTETVAILENACAPRS